MSLAFLIFLVALVPALIGLYTGWRSGGANAIRQLLVLIFAAFATLRAWYFISEKLKGVIQIAPIYVVIGTFLVLFCLTFLLASFAVRLGADRFRSVKANPLDSLLGAIFGATTGLFAGAIILFAVTLIFPLARGGAPLDLAAMPYRLDRAPFVAFRTVEAAVGIPSDSSAHTVLPAQTYPPFQWE